MEYKALEQPQQLQELKEAQGFNVIFIHNTTCPISKGVRSQFEQEAKSLPEVENVYFLDMLAHRDISDAIEEQFGVEHQSPQLILIKNGKAVYDEALYEISAEATANAVRDN